MLRVTNDKRLFCPSQSSPTTSSTDVKNTPNLLMSNTQNPVTNVPIRLISKSSGDKKRELQLRKYLKKSKVSLIHASDYVCSCAPDPDNTRLRSIGIKKITPMAPTPIGLNGSTSSSSINGTLKRDQNLSKDQPLRVAQPPPSKSSQYDQNHATKLKSTGSIRSSNSYGLNAVNNYAPTESMTTTFPAALKATDAYSSLALPSSSIHQSQKTQTIRPVRASNHQREPDKTATANSNSSINADKHSKRFFNQMEYSDILEVARNQQRQIEMNDTQLDDHRRIIGSLSIVKRPSALLNGDMNDIKMQISNLHAQILRDEQELDQLVAFQRETRQLSSHNQRQCGELRQLEDAYGRDEELLRKSVAKVEDLQKELDSLYKHYIPSNNGLAPKNAYEDKKQSCYSHFVPSTSQADPSSINSSIQSRTKNSMFKDLVHIRPRASIEPFERQSNRIYTAESLENGRHDIKHGLTEYEYGSRNGRTLLSPKIDISQRINYYQERPILQSENISLARGNSITAVKRRSWVTEMNNENMWRFVVEEQKKGRTHISFADVMEASKAAEVELEAEQQANPCQIEHQHSKHLMSEIESHQPLIPNSSLKSEETNVQDHNEENREEKTVQNESLHFGNNANKSPEDKPCLSFVKTESIPDHYPLKNTKPTKDTEDNADVTIETLKELEQIRLENLIPYRTNTELGSCRNKIFPTEEKLELFNKEFSTASAGKAPSASIEDESDEYSVFSSDDSSCPSPNVLPERNENDIKGRISDDIHEFEELEAEILKTDDNVDEVDEEKTKNAESLNEELEHDNTAIQAIFNFTNSEGVATDESSSSSDDILIDEDSFRPVKGIKGILSKGNRNMAKSSRQVIFDRIVLFMDMAYEGQYDEFVELALQIEDISVANSEGITALHFAICAGNYTIVKFLIEKDADVNAIDQDGWTPLHCAASCNNHAILKQLIENGACPYSITNKSEIALNLFDRSGDYEAGAEYIELVNESMGVVNSRKVYAAHSYEAFEEDELSFEEGSELRVICRSEDQGGNSFENPGSEWWCCELVNSGKQGLVPRNYLSLFPRKKHQDRYRINITLSRKSEPNVNGELSKLIPLDNHNQPVELSTYA